MNHRTNSGFTLIEIMVVVVILGVLASIVVPRVMDRPDEARLTKAKHDIHSLEAALRLYRLDNYSFPTTDQGMEALVKKPSIEPIPANWKKGGYLDRLPKDPWQTPYKYISPGTHGTIDIYSLGADNQEGGEDMNTDINNWTE
ncbi:MAG: type II secretion system major pseudopilin GspG [Methylococcales bacterium]|jgi:general secretion pathway protein G|nr:type II secretion system major pseudopilin GspG [Methylococcales bacterium]MBT7411340.1 type II secretion system major pseudopilin GspG [Methylococcales bacterium]